VRYSHARITPMESPWSPGAEGLLSSVIQGNVAASIKLPVPSGCSHTVQTVGVATMLGLTCRSVSLASSAAKRAASLEEKRWRPVIPVAVILLWRSLSEERLRSTRIR
jgi:hypothetical protein